MADEDAVRWPLSRTQAGRLVRDRTRGRTPYNVHVDFEVDGELDPADLAEALGQLTAQHPALRARLDSTGTSMVVEEATATPLTVHMGLTEVELEATRVQASSHLFERGQAPLWSCQLLSTRHGRRVLTLTFDHFIVDGLSVSTFVDELATRLPPIGAGTAHPSGASYGDFARLEAATVRSGLDAAMAYWTEHLAGTAVNRPVLLPCCRDPTGPLSGHVERVEQILDPVENSAFHQLARQERVTPFILFLAAVAATLADASGEADITMRVPVHGRPLGYEHTLGWFANLVVLRLRHAGGSAFADVVRHTRSCWIAQLPHQNVPYDVLLERVESARLIRDHRPPVVTVNSGWPMTDVSFNGARLIRLPPLAGPGEDEAGLQFMLRDGAGRTTVGCSFDVARFEPEDVRLLLGAVKGRLVGQ